MIIQVHNPQIELVMLGDTIYSIENNTHSTIMSIQDLGYGYRVSSDTHHYSNSYNSHLKNYILIRKIQIDI